MLCAFGVVFAMSAIQVDHLTYRYGSRIALNNVSFHVQRGEIFGLLGPNGGGKSTTFRILSTFLPPVVGLVHILGLNASRSSMEIRKKIGVVFQSGSMDRKLTVEENLIHQGHLYGLRGEPLRHRIRELLFRFGMTERTGDLVETLSGGLRRRAELAKCMLHKPELLLLDEPSSGLDPAVRLELWSLLKELRDQDHVTVLLTTHFMEEAERCDRIAILDEGKLVDIGRPDELKRRIGGEVVTIQTTAAQSLQESLHTKFGIASTIVHDTVRLEIPNGHEWISKIMNAYPGKIDAITVGRPTLEDVFIHLTGHRIENNQ